MTTTNADILADLDASLDAAVPCEMIHRPCDEAVEWILTHTCCGVQFLSCETHRIGYMRSLFSRLLGGRPPVCMGCGETKFTPTWRAI